MSIIFLGVRIPVFRPVQEVPMHIRFAVLVAAVFAVLSMVAPPTAVAQDDLTKQLATIEKTLWKGWAQADVKPFETHLAVNAVQIGPWGITEGKADVIADVAAGSCKVEGYEQEDWKAHRVSESTAILTYTAEQHAVCDGEESPEHIAVSAVYVMENGEWKSASYHETDIGDDDDDDDDD
jgi:hypothetical protein